LGGLIPLSDASRRPVRLPVVTAFIIVVNAFVFLLELMRGDAFVMRTIVRLFSRPNRALGGKLGGSDGTRTRGLLRDRRSNQLNYALASSDSFRFPPLPSDSL
jgi:membrane associated rhomboid family serine protease